MSSSREESPDWLRSFQAPTRSVMTLSSGSESPLDDDPVSDDEDEIKLSKFFKKDTQIINNQDGKESPVQKASKAKSPNKNKNVELTHARKRKRKRKRNDPSEKEEEKDDERVVKRKTSEKPKPQEQNHSVWTLSSDSESCPDTSPARKDIVHNKELIAHDKTQHVEDEEDKVAVIDKGEVSLDDKASILKSPKKQLKKDTTKSSKKKKENNVVDGENDGEIDLGEDDLSEKQEGPQVSSSRLPLVLSEKVQRSKALVECEGDSIDLSGDVGAVGRIVISDTPSGNHDMFLDLKGTIYKTTIVPSRTFCVVSFGQSEAKIEAIMDDFIQLKSQSNVYESETMVEGTLDGFSFDSEEEAENLPKAIGQNDKNEAADEQPKGKTKGKAEKTRGAAGKKAKTGGGKQSKKVTKKTQVPKKSKTKK